MTEHQTRKVFIMDYSAKFIVLARDGLPLDSSASSPSTLPLMTRSWNSSTGLERTITVTSTHLIWEEERGEKPSSDVYSISTPSKWHLLRPLQTHSSPSLRWQLEPTTDLMPELIPTTKSQCRCPPQSQNMWGF